MIEMLNRRLPLATSTGFLILLSSLAPLAESSLSENGSEAAAESNSSSKSFLSGYSKQQIADAISILSSDPMLLLAQEHGITTLMNKDFLVAGQGTSSAKQPKILDDGFVDTDPIRSGNEPGIAAHPYDPTLLLAFHKAGLKQ